MDDRHKVLASAPIVRSSDAQTPIILIATTGPEPERNQHVDRLLRSLAESHYATAQLHLVVQGQQGSSPLQREWAASFPFLALYSVGERLSLASARNHALRILLPRISDDAIIGFPDDDCFYPKDFLRALNQAFQLSSWDIVGGSYSGDAIRIATSRFSPREGRFDFDSALRYASSITVFYRGCVVRRVGLFDDRFGVGALFGSAEDNDYLIRALKDGYEGYYCPSLLVGHEVRPSRRGKYFGGGVALLWKHRDVQPYRLRFVRRVAGGLRLVILGELEITAFLTAFARCRLLNRS